MKSISLIAATSILLTGCAGQLGPSMMKRDSLSYNESLQTAVDEQLLLNIVRLKYRDNPIFLDVGTVSSAYEFNRAAIAGFSIDLNTFEGTKFNPTVSASCTDKPTTVYQPLKGESLVKQMMSPITLQTMYLLNSSGWRIDRILRCCVQRMNNLKNAVSASRPTPSLAPDYQDFLEVTQLFHELEIQDNIDIVAERSSTSDKFDFVIKIDQNDSDRRVVERIWTLLDLTPETYVIRMVPFHSREHVANELLIDTRSPLSVLYFLSQGVHAPECDTYYGLVTLTRDAEGNVFDWENVLGGIMTIHSSPCVEERTAVSVNYRGTNFFIRDNDLTSKSTFSLLAQLMALQTGNPVVPILTLQLN